jgi:LysM repeat protein
VVKKGDTLGAIARRYGVTSTALARANGLDPKRSLRIGQKLTIPSAAPAATPSGVATPPGHPDGSSPRGAAPAAAGAGKPAAPGAAKPGAAAKDAVKPGAAAPAGAAVKDAAKPGAATPAGAAVKDAAKPGAAAPAGAAAKDAAKPGAATPAGAAAKDAAKPGAANAATFGGEGRWQARRRGGARVGCRPAGRCGSAVGGRQAGCWRARGCAAAPAPRVHVGRSGETLSGIARRYGVTTTALARANGLDPKRPIRPGQQLVIPE